MVINFSAIGTLAAIILITAIGEGVAPAVNLPVRVFVVTIVTSLLAETIGLAPRVFWVVPLWLVGLTFLGVHVYVEYGVIGVVVVVLAAAVLLAFTIVIGNFHMRRKERRDLAQKISTADLAGLNPIYDQAWDTLHDAVLCPSETSWSEELCRHNYKVARIAVPWLLARNPTARRVERLRQIVEDFSASGQSLDSVAEDQLSSDASWLQAMIRDRDALDRDALDRDVAVAESTSARIARLREQAGIDAR